MDASGRAITPEELAGFASCLAQIANVKVVLQGPAGPVELDRGAFRDALMGGDPALAGLVLQWLDAARAMREHIERYRAADVLPAEPFRLGISGHVM